MSQPVTTSATVIRVIPDVCTATKKMIGPLMDLSFTGMDGVMPSEQVVPEDC